jgi:hypothetical protein
MITFLFQRIKPVAALLAAVSMVTLGLSGCGDSGGSDDVKNQPAPQTFNGLVLTLYSQGVTLTFLRSEGNAVDGVETGAVSMRAAPIASPLVDSSGTPSFLIPSSQISAGQYTYVRTSPEGGTLTVTGSGNNVFVGTVTGVLLPVVNYFIGNFTRQYDILFGTDGTTITGINVNDSGEGIPYPGIAWIDATLATFGGGSVPISWSVEQSNGLNLPKLYPQSVNLEAFVVTPTDLLEPIYNYQFLNSTFTRFSDARGDFLEEGVGNRNILDDPVLTVINFDYQPDPNTINQAKIRIYANGESTLTYDLTFISLEAGTYVLNDGSTGTFEFPFLQE